METKKTGFRILKNKMSDKKKMFYWLLTALFVVGVFFLVKNGVNPASMTSFNEGSFLQTKVQYLKIAGVTIKADLALSSDSQIKGLSGRKDLKSDEGMLFVFDRPGKYQFWMKGMNFPIDIIWIGEDSRVVYIKENASPESYPESFVSDKEARYVLEVISSFSQKNNLKVGDKIEFLPS